MNCFSIYTFFKVLIAPASLVFGLLLIAFLTCHRYFSRICIGLALALLTLSLPPVTKLLTFPLQHISPLDLKQLKTGPHMAIVVLGGGENDSGREYNEPEDIGYASLQRLRYGALLARKTRLPVLVSAGSPDNCKKVESYYMSQTLIRDFGIPKVWEEGVSRTTYESAREAKKILEAHHITEIYLVTTAIHMPRSVLAFKTLPIKIIPAPCNYYDFTPHGVAGWLPNVWAFYVSSCALKEYEGFLFYKLRINPVLQRITK